MSQVAEPGAETPAAPIPADGQPEDSKPPLAEDVLGPAAAFAGEPADVAASSQAPPAPVAPSVAADVTPEATAPSSPPQAPSPAFTPPTISAPSIAIPEFVPPSFKLPDFSDVSPAVLAVGGGALAAGVGAATYLAATKVRFFHITALSFAQGAGTGLEIVLCKVRICSWRAT